MPGSRHHCSEMLRSSAVNGCVPDIFVWLTETPPPEFDSTRVLPERPASTCTLYKVVSGQTCRSRDQLGSSAGVPERQMAGPNPLKGPINILELL